MPGRNYNDNLYRYGSNGQEKDDEISCDGNSYTAEFWQYDPRLGRRWNMDPVVKPWESSYAAFSNNPIYFVDPLGLNSGDPVKKGDGIGNAGTTAPNGGKRQGDGSVVGGDAICIGCGKSGEDIYGLPDEGYVWKPDNTTSEPSNPKTVGKNSTIGGQISTRARDSQKGSGVKSASAIAIGASRTRSVPGIVAGGIAITIGVLHDVIKDRPDVWVPTAEDPIAVPISDPSDPYVMLYRGVYDGHPAYPAALTGTALPGGDILDPTLHNNGNPKNISQSGFTAWSEYPSVAYDMAIRKQTGGVILAKAFKMSYIISLMSNPATASPDKFKQGEILIPGVVKGAIPIPVPK